MKLFGEFLVEKNLIKEEQLLDALLVQIDEQPSIARLIFQNNILSIPQILDVLKSQMENKMSFLGAAETFSFWDSQKEVKVKKLISSHKIPLGEILVKKKLVDLGTLTKYLDEFFGELSRQEKGFTGQEIKSKGEARDSVQQEAKQTEQKTVSDGGTAMSDIVDFLTDELANSFEEALASVSVEKLNDHTSLLNLISEIHKVAGAASLYEVKELHHFCESIETGLREVVTRSAEKIDKDVTKKLFKAVTDAQTVFKCLNSLKETNNIPVSFYIEGQSGAALKSAVDGFTLIVFDISHIEKEAT